MRRRILIALTALLVVVLLLVGGVFLVTNTDWGRERVRRYGEGIVQRNSHGIVHIGGVILNRVASPRHEQMLRTALDDIGMPVLGALRRGDLPNVLPARSHGPVPVARWISQLSSW